MKNQSDRERFIKTMANNVGYMNKEIVIAHVIEFLKFNKNFEPREAIRNSQDGNFDSFIEITGFVQINSAYAEMYIGIPKTYPVQPPPFLVNLDKNNFVINDQERLLQQRLISLQKNEMGEDFVILHFPFLGAKYVANSVSLNQLFQNVMKSINQPPLIKPKNEPKPNPIKLGNKIDVSQNSIPKNLPKVNSKQVTELVGKIYNDITELLISKQGLNDLNNNLDYNICREAYFREEHLVELKKQIEVLKAKVQKETASMSNNVSQIERQKNCDTLLSIPESQKVKLDIMSEQQALKQAEVKLRSKIEGGSAKFSDCKKIMKLLYDRQFETQTKLLRTLK